MPGTSEPAFISLGMVVLDELRFPDGRVLRDVPGGSGFYSTLGARLAVPQNESATVCCLITAGSDFPTAVRRQIEGWGVTTHYDEMPDRLSTRGLLEYENDAFGKKTFQYTTTPLQPDIGRVPQSLLQSSVIHILATPEDLERYFQSLTTFRGEMKTTRPLIAWEPSPINIHNREEEHMRAISLSDICSPNDHELLRMKGIDEAPGIPYNRALIEHHANSLSSDKKTTGRPPSHEVRRGPRVTVIRCGDQGCLTIPRCGDPIWLPPFHDYGSPHVVDPTGAGNAFLGAFSVAFARTDDAVLASAYGSVAASFAIEQIGPPRREVVNGREYWNGEAFEDRLRQYQDKVATWSTDVVLRSEWTRESGYS
ncbi:PfkB family carbohydrate kinase [Colletotrichum orchidophilum]|uniref:PfkB family carbohydrate kinase n=1 Tax=Colletotrichum orchidophilum TaxID=1209926 RepID=A0A1G4B852_9PEZI|nr:PfkB family carbohydrate kinase [Colletotrichum orchidophilum]OHE97516.1 PfkB family carbohydrate kinase [Colletotrichum orchidophilum]